MHYDFLSLLKFCLVSGTRIYSSISVELVSWFGGLWRWGILACSYMNVGILLVPLCSVTAVEQRPLSGGRNRRVTSSIVSCNSVLVLCTRLYWLTFSVWACINILYHISSYCVLILCIELCDMDPHHWQHLYSISCHSHARSVRVVTVVSYLSHIVCTVTNNWMCL